MKGKKGSPGRQSSSDKEPARPKQQTLLKKRLKKQMRKETLDEDSD